jgi:hypothetical protein
MMMAGSCEFDCKDCGSHVFAFGIEAPPANLLCSVCDWIEEFISDPAERAAMRRQLCQASPRRASPRLA